MTSKVYEIDITNAIVKALNKRTGCYVQKRKAGPDRKGQPDITGCYNGMRVEIKVKLPGNMPTIKQAQWLGKWRAVGALTGWATSVEEAEAIVDQK